MIIHIAPWSNDPSGGNRAPPLPPLLLLFSSELRTAVLPSDGYCPVIQVHPYLSLKKGEFLSEAKRVCAKASKEKTARLAEDLLGGQC